MSEGSAGRWTRTRALTRRTRLCQSTSSRPCRTARDASRLRACASVVIWYVDLWPNDPADAQALRVRLALSPAPGRFPWLKCRPLSTRVCFRPSATSQPSKQRTSLTLRPRQIHKSIAHPSVHSATLGKGKSDDTLVKVKNGDLMGKGEVTLVFGKQDTHVDRAGRTLIRDTFDDAGLTMTVSPLPPWRRGAVSLNAQAARCACALAISAPLRSSFEIKYSR